MNKLTITLTKDQWYELDALIGFACLDTNDGLNKAIVDETDEDDATIMKLVRLFRSMLEQAGEAAKEQPKKTSYGFWPANKGESK